MANSEPLIRIAKRDGMPRGKAWLIRLAAVLLALLVCGVVICRSSRGYNPAGRSTRPCIDGALGTQPPHLDHHPATR